MENPSHQKSYTHFTAGYIAHVLNEFNLVDCQPAPTPCCAGVSLGKRARDEPELDTKRFPYRKAIGCLQYPTDSTRPDIPHITNALARYLHSPCKRHWNCFKQVLRYLKGTASYGILYPSQTAPFESYSDSDFASDPDKSRSTSGSVHCLNGAPIYWQSQKQSETVRSTCSAEYIAAAAAAEQCIWLRKLLKDLSVPINSPTTLHMDNQGAIKISLANRATKRTKYIDTVVPQLKTSLPGRKSGRYARVTRLNNTPDPGGSCMVRERSAKKNPRYGTSRWLQR